MLHGESLSETLATHQIQHILHEAAWAAQVLLRVDASTICFASPTVAEPAEYKVAVWHGREVTDPSIGPSGPYAQAFRAGRRSISWSQKNRCTDPEWAALGDRMGLVSGLIVPLFVGDDLIGLWWVAAGTEREFGESDELMLRTLAENVSLTVESAVLSAENLRFRREADALYEIGKEISQLMDLDRVLEVIAEKTCSLLNAEISYIALADDQAQVIRVRVTRGTRHNALSRMVIKYGEGLGGYVASTRKPLLLDNYPQDPRPKPPGIAEIVATENILSNICAPMFTRRGLVGVLYAASRRQAVFNPLQLDLLSALGTQAAIAIENARLYQEAKDVSDRLRADKQSHEQLLNLVLSNQGLQAIADTLSTLVRCPIVVQDDRFRVLCSSLTGVADVKDEQAADLRNVSAELWNDPDYRDHLDALRVKRRIIRVPPKPENKINCGRAIVPIVAGNALLGYVSAVEVGGTLNEQQHAAMEQASIVFALEILKQQAAESAEQRLAGDYVEELISGRAPDLPAAHQRAARHNFDLRQPHRVMVLEFDEPAQTNKRHRWTETDTLLARRRFAGTVRDTMIQSTPGALVGKRDDNVVVILPDGTNNGSANSLAIAQGLVQALKSAVPELAVWVGVGRLAAEVGELARSFQDARLALKTVRNVGGKASVVAFEELGVLPLILQSQDQQALLEFMERHLRVVADYDVRHGTALVATLEAFLANNGNLQATSRACHIHLNTLKYRLNRIREISGVNLESGEARFNLQLALSIRQALDLLGGNQVDKAPRAPAH